MSSNNSRISYGRLRPGGQPEPEPKPRRRGWWLLLVAVAVFLAAAASVLTVSIANAEKRAEGRPVIRPTEAISRACGGTRYPRLCLESLVGSPGALKAGGEEELVPISVNVTLHRFGQALSFSADMADWKMDTIERSAYEACIELLDDSVYLLARSLLSVTPTDGANNNKGQGSSGTTEDVLTWLSAAMTNQDTCTEGLGMTSGAVKTQMSERLKDLSELVSNALAIYAAAYGAGGGSIDFSGVPVQNRRLLSTSSIEDEGFPEWLSSSDRELLMSTTPPVPTTAPPAPTTTLPAPKTAPPTPTIMPPTTKTAPPAPTTMPPVTKTAPPAPSTAPPAPTTMPPATKTAPPAPTTTPAVPKTAPPAPTTTPPAPKTAPPPQIQANVVVSQGGEPGTVKTIQEAIKKAPEQSEQRFIIYVKAGRYEEINLKVGRRKTNLWFIGDGRGRTVIAGVRSVARDNITTFHTASFAATGTGFVAKDITFVNEAGPDNHQAVALRVGADHAVIFRCEIKGYQDTLYTHSQRQFYRDCDIYGTVDFIFGNAAVVFQHCNLYARKPVAMQKNTITAQNRKDPNQNTGMSIHACQVLATGDLQPLKAAFPTFLGRPWKVYSRVVYMMSSIGDHVDPKGWLEWNATSPVDTLYYGEFMNVGPRSDTGARVKWPGLHVNMTKEEALKFTVDEFIFGSVWLAQTGVAFQAGLTA